MSLYEVLLVVYLIVALILIGLVLIQQGKGAGMGASFGSGASNTVFGATGSGNFMTRATAILATAFFAISLDIMQIHRSFWRQVEGTRDGIGAELAVQYDDFVHIHEAVVQHRVLVGDLGLLALPVDAHDGQASETSPAAKVWEQDVWISLVSTPPLLVKKKVEFESNLSPSLVMVKVSPDRQWPEKCHSPHPRSG